MPGITTTRQSAPHAPESRAIEKKDRITAAVFYTVTALGLTLALYGACLRHFRPEIYAIAPHIHQYGMFAGVGVLTLGSFSSATVLATRRVAVVRYVGSEKKKTSNTNLDRSDLNTTAPSQEGSGLRRHSFSGTPMRGHFAIGEPAARPSEVKNSTPIARPQPPGQAETHNPQAAGEGAAVLPGPPPPPPPPTGSSRPAQRPARQEGGLLAGITGFNKNTLSKPRPKVDGAPRSVSAPLSAQQVQNAASSLKRRAQSTAFSNQAEPQKESELQRKLRLRREKSEGQPKKNQQAQQSSLGAASGPFDQGRIKPASHGSGSESHRPQVDPKLLAQVRATGGREKNTNPGTLTPKKKKLAGGVAEKLQTKTTNNMLARAQKSGSDSEEKVVPETPGTHAAWRLDSPPPVPARLSAQRESNNRYVRPVALNSTEPAATAPPKRQFSSEEKKNRLLTFALEWEDLSPEQIQELLADLNKVKKTSPVQFTAAEEATLFGSNELEAGLTHKNHGSAQLEHFIECIQWLYRHIIGSSQPREKDDPNRSIRVESLTDVQSINKIGEILKKAHAYVHEDETEAGKKERALIFLKYFVDLIVNKFPNTAFSKMQSSVEQPATVLGVFEVPDEFEMVGAQAAESSD